MPVRFGSTRIGGVALACQGGQTGASARVTRSELCPPLLLYLAEAPAWPPWQGAWLARREPTTLAGSGRRSALSSGIKKESSALRRHGGEPRSRVPRRPDPAHKVPCVKDSERTGQKASAGVQSVLAPDRNHWAIRARSASVIWVELLIGISLVTTTCWYTDCACCLSDCAESSRTFFICSAGP